MSKAKKGETRSTRAEALRPAPEFERRVWQARVGPGGSPRADIFIAESGALSRSQIKARGAEIRVNGSKAKPSRPLKEGDLLDLSWVEEEVGAIEAEDLPLSVLYQDERLMVVDKAQGMVTHPGAGNHRGTLANASLYIAQRERAMGAASGIREPPARSGIVHRLDKDTSGLIVVAKDLEAQVLLASQFQARLARKEYIAITRGQPPAASGRIADRLGRDPRDRKRFASLARGGKAAVTDYRVLSRWDGYALVSLRPKTGRTHQLRVHMAGLGCPILGDPIYGKKDGRFPSAGLMLHAYRLKITLPGRSEPSLFTAPLPERFKETLRALAEAFGIGRLSAPRRGEADHVP
jgi:23S rRNA pseudouridine1911/1915/1917 synthase